VICYCHFTVLLSSFFISGLREETNRYESCYHTPADEEFRLIQLQVLCLLVGSLSFMSVRRQKRSHATLFDQRKITSSMKIPTDIAALLASDMGGGDIEMNTTSNTIANSTTTTTTTNTFSSSSSEMVPLTAPEPLEIV
jgi:hypothetical protein